MFSFRSFFGRSPSRAVPPAPRKPSSRKALRPRLECLEDRTLLNARFVVPVGAPVDNVSNFATLSAALTTPGLVNGDSITIRAGSAPGQVGAAALQNVNALVANLTIQGEPGIASAFVPQFQITDASTFGVAQAGFRLRNVNVGLVGAGQLVFTTNATITDSTVVNQNVALNPASTGAIVFNSTNDVLTHSTLVDNSNTNSNFLAVLATAGNANLITGNNFVENGSANAAIRYVIAGAGAVTDQVVGNTITSNTTTSGNFLSDGIAVNGAISGLTIRDNTVADSGNGTGATVGIDVGAGATGIQVMNNLVRLIGAGAIGVRVTGGTAGNTMTGANLLFNHISTSLGATGGTGLLITQAGGLATDSVRVSAQGNDFQNDQFGVRIVTNANTAPSNLTIDLGGGATSQGGNNFRNTPTTGTATGGAIVVSGANPTSATTIQAQHDIFTTNSSATGAVSNGGFANATINVAGNLTGSSAFVQTVYEDFLHRVGDLSNMSDAGGAVNASPSVVAASAVRSAEGLGVLVDGLYQRILGRSADAMSRSNTVNFMQAGGTVEQVIVLMVTSDEFRGRAGSDSGYVQSLYNLLLGRVASQQEVDNTVGAMATLGRAAVANLFVDSTEFRADVVTELYAGLPTGATGLMSSSVVGLFPNLLGRTSVSMAEVNNTVNSGIDLLSLEVLFASSQEFFMNG